MESPQHQEWRSRQRVSPWAIFIAGLIAGGITFVFSGGTPWTTAGTMNSIMGRVVRTNFLTLLLGHLFLAWLYAAVLALATYHRRLVPAIFTASVTILVCYGVNAAIFHGLSWAQESPEGRALATHFVFGLFAVAVYKAVSVPRPRPDDADRPA